MLKVRNSGTELELFDFEFGTVEICYQYVISMLTLFFFQFGPPLGLQDLINAPEHTWPEEVETTSVTPISHQRNLCEL